MKANYKIPCSKDHLKAVRGFVKDSLAGFPIKNDTVHLLVLAIDEACANAMIHGNLCDEKRSIQIDLDVQDAQVDVEIYDIGNYRPAKVDSHIDWDNCIEKGNKGGLGLKIMHTIMDKVEFYRRDNQHVCRLRKVLS